MGSSPSQPFNSKRNTLQPLKAAGKTTLSRAPKKKRSKNMKTLKAKLPPSPKKLKKGASFKAAKVQELEVLPKKTNTRVRIKIKAKSPEKESLLKRPLKSKFPKKIVGEKKPFDELEKVEALRIAEESLNEMAPSEKTTIMIYMHEIGKTPLLKSEEEISLARQVKKGNFKARAQMIQANLRLVVKIAHDYSNFGLPLMDLISEGNLGLIKAVERFDPDKGGKLSTYASWWIRQSMKRALANQGKTIRLPVHLVDKIALIRKATAKLQDQLQREPSNEEIAAETGFPTNKVAHLKSVSIRPTSLDVKVGEEENTTLSDLVSDDNALTPYEDLNSKNLTKDLGVIIEGLGPREAEIIRLRFGLSDKPPITLEEAGAHFGITRERVRQLQNMALRKIRGELSARERLKSAHDLAEENEELNKLQILKELLRSPLEK